MGFGSLYDRVRGNIWEYSPSCGMQRGMPVQIPTLFTAVRPRTTQASHCSPLPCGGPGGEGRCSGRDQVMAGKLAHTSLPPLTRFQGSPATLKYCFNLLELCFLDFQISWTASISKNKLCLWGWGWDVVGSIEFTAFNFVKNL